MHLATLHPKRLVAKAGAGRSGLVTTGLLGLTAIGAQFGLVASAQAHPASFLHYQRGYYLDKYAGKTWLCYGWDNGAYRCTQHWHRDAHGHLISDNTRWVPNALSSGMHVAQHPAAPHRKVDRHSTRRPAPAPHSSGGSVQSQIQDVFGPYAGRALQIAACESGFNPNAASRISSAKGVFQFLDSTWATTSYRNYSPFNAWANIHAAYEVFARDGHSWREWQCNGMD